MEYKEEYILEHVASYLKAEELLSDNEQISRMVVFPFHVRQLPVGMQKLQYYFLIFLTIEYIHTLRESD